MNATRGKASENNILFVNKKLSCMNQRIRNWAQNKVGIRVKRK